MYLQPPIDKWHMWYPFTLILTSYSPLRNASLKSPWIIILLVRGYGLISTFFLAEQKVSLFSVAVYCCAASELEEQKLCAVHERVQCITLMQTF